MTTLLLTSTPHYVGDKLALGELSLLGADGTPVSSGTARTADNGEVAVELAAGDTLQIRLKGAAVAIDARSSFERQTAQPWSQDGADAVSPVLTPPGLLSVYFGPAPDGSTSGSTTTTVIVRINKGGKPDDFLQSNFPPR